MKFLNSNVFLNFISKNLNDSNNYLNNFKNTLKDKSDLEKLAMVDDILSCQRFDEVSLTREFKKLVIQNIEFIKMYNLHQLIFSLHSENLRKNLYQKIINNKLLLISLLNSKIFLEYKSILYPRDIESFELLANYIPDIIRKCNGQGIYIYIHFLTLAYLFCNFDKYIPLKFNSNILKQKLIEHVSASELDRLYQMTIPWNKSIENIIKNILEAKRLINTISSCYNE